jgi:hypothetical protein
MDVCCALESIVYMRADTRQQRTFTDTLLHYSPTASTTSFTNRTTNCTLQYCSSNHILQWQSNFAMELHLAVALVSCSKSYTVFLGNLFTYLHVLKCVGKTVKSREIAQKRAG